MLPLPFELRNLIYTSLEPRITIIPQYPDRIRRRIDPNWEPDPRIHPMMGMNSIQDADIKSRYLNLNNTFSPPFLPSHTTFRFYANCKGINAAHVRWFFEHDERNRLGVRFVEFIVDDYQDEKDVLETLSQFPRLEKVKIVLRFDHQKWDWRAYCREMAIKRMKEEVVRFFKESDCWDTVLEEKRPLWRVEEEMRSCICWGCNGAPCTGEHHCDETKSFEGECVRARYHGVSIDRDPDVDEQESLEDEFDCEFLWTRG